jgi:hypothetical protein
VFRRSPIASSLTANVRQADGGCVS